MFKENFRIISLVTVQKYIEKNQPQRVSAQQLICYLQDSILLIANIQITKMKYRAFIKGNSKIFVQYIKNNYYLLNTFIYEYQYHE